VGAVELGARGEAIDMAYQDEVAELIGRMDRRKGMPDGSISRSVHLTSATISKKE
jgi:hypothetical protein